MLGDVARGVRQGHAIEGLSGGACLVYLGRGSVDPASLSLDWEQHATTLGMGTRAAVQTTTDWPRVLSSVSMR